MATKKQEKEVKISLEKIMESIHLISYDDWVKNFALKLTNIWK